MILFEIFQASRLTTNRKYRCASIRNCLYLLWDLLWTFMKSFKLINIIILALGYFELLITWLTRQISNVRTIMRNNIKKLGTTSRNWNPISVPSHVTSLDVDASLTWTGWEHLAWCLFRGEDKDMSLYICGKSTKAWSLMPSALNSLITFALVLPAAFHSWKNARQPSYWSPCMMLFFAVLGPRL